MVRQGGAILVACACLSAAPVAAQENAAWPERMYVTIDVPFQPLNNGFSESVSLADAFAKNEKDTFNAGYASTKGAMFDVGAGVRVGGRFGVGVIGSWFQRSGNGSFDLSVPSPLAANKPRALSGTVSGLNRREVALHVHVLYAVPLSRRARVMLSGGPSAFNVRQDVVQGVEFDEAAGFSSIKLNQVLTTSVTKTVVGFNVGADVTWLLASHFGVGSVTRYTRANLTIDPALGASTLTRSLEARAGGLQLGAGVRVLF